MSPREKLLALVVAAVAGLFALRTVYAQLQDSFTSRENRIAALQKEIGEKQLKVERGKMATRRIAAWEEKSLPADKQLARSLYQKWLLSHVERLQLGDADVSTQALPERRDAYEKLAFSVTGEATLEETVRLLHEFYSANHLHLLRRFSLKPQTGGKRFDIQLSVEALVLPGAKRQDSLSGAPSGRLALPDLAAYESAIVKRNLFAEYVPPPPPRPPIVERRPEPPRPAPPPKPSFDDAKYAKLTAILEQDGLPQVWVMLQTKGETLRLFEGDDFRVGELKCRVLKIGLRDAEFDVGGKRMLATLGDSLREAVALPAGDL